MKIVYIVKTKLHYYPPCISQIRMIKKLKLFMEHVMKKHDNF